MSIKHKTGDKGRSQVVKDLSEGKPFKVLLLFALPLLGSVVFQQMYNMADTVIAGKAIDDNALAAVGASYPITMIFMAVALGCNLGCSVIVSRFFGQKHYREVKESISTILISVAVLGIVMTGAGIALGNVLMRAVNTPEVVFDTALAYLYIYIGGFLFVLLYNVCTGIFSALGDSRTPLYFLIALSLGNIGLDLLFVLAFGMGVPGLAWATFIAQGIAAVLCIITLIFRLRKLKGGVNEEKKSHKFFSKVLLVQMLAVAIPSVLQQSFISVGNMFIQALVNGHGETVLAGYTAAVKLNTFVLTTITTVSGALSSFTAQNLGARKPERIKKGLLASITMAVCLLVPFTLFYLIFPRTALMLFMDDVSGEAMATGTQFLRIVTPFYAVVSLKLICDAVLRGAESMKLFMVTTFADLLIRVVICFIADPFIGTTGLWISWPIGWSASAVISVVFYFTGIWDKTRKDRFGRRKDKSAKAQ